MCRYTLEENGKKISCEVEKYFQLFFNKFNKENYSLTTIEVPHDLKGYCIFHSKPRHWKEQNNFDVYLRILGHFIKEVYNDNIIINDNSAFKNINLIGFCFIGSVDDTKPDDKIIFLKNLKSSAEFNLFFNHSLFLDPIHIEGCDLKNSVVEFRNSTFQSNLKITKTILNQISFNDCNLKGGLFMNNCHFKSTVECCGIKSNEDINIITSKFDGRAFFSGSFFNASASFDQNEFSSTADWSDCRFSVDSDFENNIFKSEVKFTDSKFSGPLIFQENSFYSNVYFNSKTVKNRMFYDSVSIGWRYYDDFKKPLNGKLIFENVNYSNIVQEDREELSILEKENKVSIGPGCIKYRVQTKPVKFKGNMYTANLLEDILLSYRNYFTNSNGFNLGVEFSEKKINSVQYFFFTDEDISLEELEDRLKMTDQRYWDFTLSDTNGMSKEEISKQIDNFVSKAAVLSKIAYRKRYDLWNDDDTEKFVEALPTANFDSRKLEINLQINQYIEGMKINKLIAKDGGQINIADRIDSINFSPNISTQMVEEDFEILKNLIKSISESELKELEDDVSNNNYSEINESGSKKFKEKVYNLIGKYGLPLSESLAGSALYDAIKVILGIS